MNTPFINHKLSQRMAEHAQLIVEEKWLIEALDKIKKQRNSLQIERLHLESLKSNLKHGSDPPTNKQQDIVPSRVTIASTSTAMDVMKRVPLRRMSTRSRIEFEEPMIETASCNKEILDLKVTKPSYSQSAEFDYNMEEYDEDEDDDDDIDDCDNVLIDMNMLMNCKTDWKNTNK